MDEEQLLLSELKAWQLLTYAGEGEFVTLEDKPRSTPDSRRRAGDWIIELAEEIRKEREERKA